MKQPGKFDIKGCTNQLLKSNHHYYTQYGPNEKLWMNLVHNICAQNKSLTGDKHNLKIYFSRKCKEKAEHYYNNEKNKRNFFRNQENDEETKKRRRGWEKRRHVENQSYE